MHTLKNFFLLVLLVAGLTGLGGCQKHSSEETAVVKPPPVPVRVVVVREQPVRHRSEATGTVEATRRATIAAKVTGTITRLPVALGSVVKKGDLLVEISAREINARVAQAQAQMEQARRNYEREQRLLEQGASTPQTVKSLEEALQIAEAGYNEAQTMSGYTAITAPFDGVIARKHVQAGDLATPGVPLLELEDNHQLQVVAAVPEAMVLRISRGDRLPWRIGSGAAEQTGTVTEIAPSADPLSRTTTVKLAIDDSLSMRPGQYVRVLMPGDSVNTLLVPEQAIIRYGQMERLYVVENAIARLRLVRRGERFGDQVEILAGLDSGEQVVIQGHDLLSDGQPVRVVPE